ncbi:hypothetical protein ACWEWI_25785 [Streptomyces sp. NPDC003753]
MRSPITFPEYMRSASRRAGFPDRSASRAAGSRGSAGNGSASRDQSARSAPSPTHHHPPSAVAGHPGRSGAAGELGAGGGGSVNGRDQLADLLARWPPSSATRATNAALTAVVSLPAQMPHKPPDSDAGRCRDQAGERGQQRGVRGRAELAEWEGLLTDAAPGLSRAPEARQSALHVAGGAVGEG